MIGLRIELSGSYEERTLDGLFGTIVAREQFRNGVFSYLVAIENWDMGHNGRSRDVPSHLLELMEANNCWWISIMNIKCPARDPCKDPAITKREAIINKIKYLDKKFKERNLT